MSQHHFSNNVAGSIELNNAHLKQEEGVDDSINGTQMSTHLLYSTPSLPISLIAPMPGNEFSQVHSEGPLHPQVQKASLLSDSSSSPVEIDGIHYNSRGYEICGQLNQHSKPCQRIGSCPFHKKNGEGEGEETNTNKTQSPKPTHKKKAPSNDPPIKRGPYKRGWTKDEHILFLNGLQIHGKGAWKEISMIVQTRTPTQIQSHAQKYFLRQKQEVKNKRSIHDISLDDLNDITPEPVRSLSQPKTPMHMSRGPTNFTYPMLTQFPQEHLNMILNPLHPMLPNTMSPSFQLPYGANNWLPHIYPFAMPMALSPNMHEDHRNLGIELDDRDPSEQVLSLKQSQEDCYSPRIGEKRAYDSFSFHNYPNLGGEDKSPSKVVKTSENEFLFS